MGLRALVFLAVVQSASSRTTAYRLRPSLLSFCWTPRMPPRWARRESSLRSLGWVALTASLSGPLPQPTPACSTAHASSSARHGPPDRPTMSLRSAQMALAQMLARHGGETRASTSRVRSAYGSGGFWRV